MLIDAQENFSHGPDADKMRKMQALVDEVTDAMQRLAGPGPEVGPTWTVVAQHVPFLSGTLRLVSRLPLKDLR